MKRRVLTILLLLLSGTVVNVAVAWGLSLWVQPLEKDIMFLVVPHLRVDPAPEYQQWWQERVPDPSWGEVWGTYSASCTGVARTRLWSDVRHANVPTARYSVLRIRCGWPLLSLEGSAWTDETTQYIFTQNAIGPPLVPFGLPARPLWGGFLVNTACYALAIWMLGIPGTQLRHQIRRRRGRCIRCGYDLRGDLAAGCPECGWNREEGGTASERSESAV